MISRAEYHSAAAGRRLPCFQYCSVDADKHFPDALLEQAAITSPTSALNIPRHRFEVFNIIYRLHRLGLAISLEWFSQVSRLVISDRLHEVEYLILKFLAKNYTSRCDDADLENESISEAIILAGHIFLFGAIRVVPTPMKIFDIFLARLRVALDNTKSETWQELSLQDLRLWVLFIGAVASQVRPEILEYFVVQITADLVSRPVAKSTLEHKLKGTAWADDYCRQPLDKLWTDLEFRFLGN